MVQPRPVHAAELRIKAAGFQARTTLEDFDWDAQPATRQQIAVLASGGFLLEAQMAGEWSALICAVNFRRPPSTQPSPTLVDASTLIRA